jgi:hypothetical protein
MSTTELLEFEADDFPSKYVLSVNGEQGHKNVQYQVVL